MKQIPYIKKQTSANTEYRKTTKQDTNWVLAQCKRIVEIAPIADELLTPNPKMPRMSNGKRNTPATMCQGVIDNFNAGQYDLSDKQCTGITEAFRIGEELIEDFESVEFNEVTVLPKLKTVTQEADRKGCEQSEDSGSTFQDLFEIVITVRGREVL